MSTETEHTAKKDTATTRTEWAVQCYTRGGVLFTGRAHRTRGAAEESGERLAKLNGADWWLVSRRVTTFASRMTGWTRPIPPGGAIRG